MEEDFCQRDLLALKDYTTVLLEFIYVKIWIMLKIQQQPINMDMLHFRLTTWQEKQMNIAVTIVSR